MLYCIVVQSIPLINEIKDNNHKNKVAKAKKEGKDPSKLKKSPYVEMPTAEKWYMSKYFIDGILKIS